MPEEGECDAMCPMLYVTHLMINCLNLMACARCFPQGLIVFLFGRTLYYELDVDAELQRGALPAAIALSHKLVPASKVVVRKTLESLKVRGVGLLTSCQYV